MDFSTLCRCCLEEFSEENPMCSNNTIMKMYLFCIQLNYKDLQGEEVPKYFCLKCRDRIKSAYLFIRFAKCCNERLQKTIVQNIAKNNSDLDTENKEDSKSDIELNKDMDDNTQTSSLQGVEETKLAIDDDYQRLIVEQKYKENFNTPVSNISSGIPKINSDEEIIPNLDNAKNNTGNNFITAPFGKQESKTNNTKQQLAATYLNSNVITERKFSMFVCNICDKRLGSKWRLNRHIKYHTKNRPVHCEKMKVNLLNHMSKHITKEKREDSLFICDMCDKRFTKRSYFINHLATHSNLQPFKCDLCQKRFKRKKTLWGHMKLHQLQQTGEKPYACDVCNKRFTVRASLNVHSTIHSEYRPRLFSCNLCDKSFITKQQLKNHGGTHSSTCPLLCTVCGRGLKNVKCLIAHMRTHSDVKPHVCGLCDYRTAYAGTLRRHEATHTNKRQHQCPHCQKKFNARNGLVRHIRTHTGEKPIQCPSCPLRFGDHWKRKTHLMRVHKVPFEEIPRLSADGLPILN